MTKQSNITPDTAIDTGTQRINLADTYVSEHNPRFHEAIDEDGIAVLSETIIASGLIQNLCGLIDAKGKVGIVAGRRRWHALQLAVQQRPDLDVIDVKVTSDLQTALGWGLLENTQRVEMDIADEIRAYASAKERGLKAPQIAKAFCATEAHVYRRLALGGLPASVLDALKAGDISLGDAKAFTVSDDAEKQEALLAEILDAHWHSEHTIKAALLDDALDADCHAMRFVSLEDYKAAGGTLNTNLFDDDATVESPDTLSALFDTKLADAAEAFRKEQNLAWVVTSQQTHIMTHELTNEGVYLRMPKTPGVLSDDQRTRHDELDTGQWWQLDDEEQAERKALKAIVEGDWTDAQRAMMGAVVYVTNAGEVSAVMGLIKADDRAQAAEAGYVQTAEAEAAENAAQSAQKKAEKSPYSAKFVDDMTAIRLAAVQTALLKKPELVLDLLAFGLSRGNHWGNQTMALRFDMERNKPQAEDEMFTLCRELGGPAPDDEDDIDDVYDNMSNTDAFDQFVSAGKKARNAEITASFARAFKSQEAPFMALLMDKAGANVRDIWSPTAENCFKRLTGKQLNDLFKALLDLDEFMDDMRSFAKLPKGKKTVEMEKLFHDPDVQKVWKVTPAQKARIDAWVPECF